jgi:tripartite-type tricarboxylate transporter receptor subunit TctC
MPLLGLPAAAQTFPSKTITIIVPFAPGASSDATARAMAAELTPRLGVSVVVANNAGGGGITGLQQMARAAADGHTLAIGAAGAVVIIPQMPGAPPFDPAKELTPVARLVDVPLVIVAHPQKGPKSLADAIATAKKLPEGLTYGSTGTNSGMHLAVEFLSVKSGARLVHVPYRGSAPAVTDAVAGQVPFVAVDLTSALPLVEAGQLTALAMIGQRRVSFAPQVPTMAELGFAGFETTAFLGLFAPLDTPAPIVNMVSGHVRDIIAKPEMQKLLRNVALEPSYLDGAAFGAFIEKDRANWRQMLAAMGKTK